MPGIFIGYTQHVGGKWSHDYLVCPLEDFQLENSTRTLGPHGDSAEVSFPRRGSMGKIHLSNKIPQRTTVIKHQPDLQEIEDSGSGACRRRADTTRPIIFDTHTWRKFI